ncbi:MAG: archaellin/type IV pilin N-terminal domain-containing protein [Dehalococcoidia bacterium]
MSRTIKGETSERGITGLETAIILIAFVVVASVFAFTVLSTGIFASERSKETVFAGLEEAKSSIEPRGSVIAYKGKVGSTETIYKVVFVISNAVKGEPVDLTAPYTAGGTGTDPDEATSAEYRTVVSYTDINQHHSDVPWTLDWVGNTNSDNLLEEGEKAEITVWLLERNTGTAIGSDDSVGEYAAVDSEGASGILQGGTLIGTNDQFTIEIKPESGAVLTIQRTAPSRLDTVMDLK